MNTKHIILLMATALMMAACAFDDPMEKQKPWVETDPDAPVPVRFSVSTSNNVDFTRATTSIVTFDADEHINVRVKPMGAENYTSYDYTTAGTGQTNVALTAPTPPPYFPSGINSTVDAYAYYPSTALSEPKFSVKDNQSKPENYKASDLMMAPNRTVVKITDPNDPNYGDGSTILTMKHLMAQLRISAVPGKDSGLTISRIEVEAKKSVVFTPESETITATTEEIGTIIVREGDGEGYVLIPPQAIGDVKIKVVTGNGAESEIATYAFAAEGSFEAGSSYGVDITLVAGQLGLTTAIANWNGLGSVIIAPNGNLIVDPISAKSYIDKDTPVTLKLTGDDRDLKVRKGTTELTYENDYTVQYLNNTGAGTAYVVVTGVGQYEGSLTVAPFTITKNASARISYGEFKYIEKTYGDEPFINDHLFDDGYGTITYESSDPTVATVNPNTGLVTIVKPSENPIKITATAADGPNYIYAARTDWYELKVNKATGSIKFEIPTDKTTVEWSSTETDNRFTEGVVKHVGNADVTYTVPTAGTDGNTCGASILEDGHTVKYTQAGSVTVTATVEDNDYYTYAEKTATYKLTVNKTGGFIDLSESSGTVNYKGTHTFTINKTHGGTLTVISENESIATLTRNGGDVTITGEKAGKTNIILTCAATNTYEEKKVIYEVEVLSVDAKYTPPTAKTSLKYNGTAQDLMTAGTVTAGGAMYYRAKPENGDWIGGGDGWSTSVPKATNAGKYKLYYRVDKDDNHVEVAEKEITNGVTISQFTPTAEWSTSTTSVNYKSSLTRTYNVKGVNDVLLTTPAVTYSSSDDEVATVDAATGTVTGVAYGTATITASFAGDTNYESKTASYTVTVNKIDNTLTLSANSGSVNYNGTSTFAITKNVSGGSLSVSSADATICKAELSGTTVTLTGKKVGNTTITVTSEAKGSYNQTKVTYAVTVNKINPTVTAPTAKSLTYNGTGPSNGSAQELINAGSTTTGTTMQYRMANSAYSDWSTTIPKATNAGTYTVYYRVVGNSNYNDVDAKSVSVKIEKKANTLTLNPDNILIKVGNSFNITVNTNASAGTVSAKATSGNTGQATISSPTNNNTFKVNVTGTTSGDCYITVTSAETDNFKSATAQYHLKIDVDDVGVALSKSSTWQKVGSNGKAYGGKVSMPYGVKAAGLVISKSATSGASYVIALYNTGGSASSDGNTYLWKDRASELTTIPQVKGYSWRVGTSSEYQTYVVNNWTNVMYYINYAGGRSCGELVYITDTEQNADLYYYFCYAHVSNTYKKYYYYVRPIFNF